MPSKPAGVAPLFLVEDVVRAAEYYRDKLGFEIGPYFLDPPVFVIVRRNDLALMLSLMEGSRGGSNTKWKGESFDATSGLKTPMMFTSSSWHGTPTW
jgi:hypothetical protein